MRTMNCGDWVPSRASIYLHLEFDGAEKRGSAPSTGFEPLPVWVLNQQEYCDHPSRPCGNHRGPVSHTVGSRLSSPSTVWHLSSSRLREGLIPMIRPRFKGSGLLGLVYWRDFRSITRLDELAGYSPKPGWLTAASFRLTVVRTRQESLSWIDPEVEVVVSAGAAQGSGRPL